MSVGCPIGQLASLFMTVFTTPHSAGEVFDDQPAGVSDCMTNSRQFICRAVKLNPLDIAILELD